MQRRVIYPALRGFQLRCGNRQSIPSSSIANWAAVNAILPSFAEGQTNRPFSRRLLNRHAPCPSHPLPGRVLRSNAREEDDLDQIPTPPAEDEHVARERVLLERLLVASTDVV